MASRRKRELRFLTTFEPSEFLEIKALVDTGTRPKGVPVTSLWLLEKLKMATEEILSLHITLEAHDEALHDLSEKWDKALSKESKKSRVDSRPKK